ncbi:MAG: hypothetical protein NPINA01_21010 [Nitrospinaceae bacterium]|nr:MAG: hypothetical protein NPINA01_21010 [Nitrospinaceae bacterium]
MTSMFPTKIITSLLCFWLFTVFSEASAYANQDLPHFLKLNRKVVSLYKSKEYASALPFAQQAVKLMDQNLPANPEGLVQALNNLGELNRKVGNHAAAEATFLRSLKISEDFLEENHPLIAILLNNLALLYEDAGKFSEAQKLYQHSLTIREKTLGPNHPTVANLVHKLATLNSDGVSSQ